MTEWNDFYVAVAGASAALTGLIFVGVSISLKKILSIRGLPDRALLSLILLLNILIVSVIFLVPNQVTTALGTEVLIIGIITWIAIFRLDLRVWKSKEKKYKSQYTFHLVTDQVATILFIVAGIFLTTGVVCGEYWIVPAILISIIKAVIDGWVLLVEINR